MFFKKRSTIIFRNYRSFGYITDNRNFGYKQAGNIIGDKILSKSGAIFFSALGRTPKTIDSIANKISKRYKDVSLDTIRNDAREFFFALEKDGFIVSGKSIKECNEKDIKFSYKYQETAAKSDESTTLLQEKSSQDFLSEYFKNKALLTHLHIEITSKCNERCVHCYIPHENKICDIEPALFENILKQCMKMKVLHITLSGGEPMLHKDFWYFLKMCRKYNFSVNVLSNLTLLNDKIISEMRANPLLGVQVSLYSMNPNIHDEITQMKGSFEKTKNAILKLIENDIPLQISCPIMKQNKDSYGDVKNWAKEHNINVSDDYVIIAKYDHTTQNLTNRLSINEIKELINNVVVNDIRYFDQMEMEVEKKKNITDDDFICSVCQSSLCITESGNVYPCAGWQDYNLGNVRESSLAEIWNNSEKVRYLRGLRRKDFPKCIQCPDKEFCTMCMVRNANEDPLGDPLAVNEYFCCIAKLNREMFYEWKNKQH